MKSSYKRLVFANAAKVAHLTYQIGETDLLRKKSLAVDPVKIRSKKIQSIIKTLKNTLSEYRKLTGKGKGIAAVQIGKPLKIAVLYSGKKFLTIINPKIIRKSKISLSYPEICMSANPIVALVKRPEWIEVASLDETGKIHSWTDKKRTRQDFITNRVLQHEIDHMEGIINIDLVPSKDLSLDSSPAIFKKAWKEIAKIYGQKTSA